MSIELEKATQFLFGNEGLAVADVKLFPGTSRNVKSEQIAEELIRSLTRIGTDNNEE